MKLRKYTEKELREAVRSSLTMRQALEKLNVAPYGGNYDVLRKAIKYFNLDTSHFIGRAWNKGRKFGPRQPIEAYLSNKQPIQSYKLKKRLLRQNILEPKCSKCGLTSWRNQQIPLELDHINGNNKDNRLENLRLLCPNCHALTPTFRSKNRASA